MTFSLRPGWPSLRTGLAGLLLSLPLWGGAQTPWENEQDEARMLGETLEAGARHQHRWQAAWLTGYGVATAYYLYDADQTDDREDRYDARVSAIKTTLAFADVLLFPPSHARRWRELDPGDGSPPDLQAARNAMAALEIEEMRRAHWRSRLGPLLVNAAGGLAIGVSDNRPGDGWVNFATGMLVSEIRIRTEPRNASRYQARALRIGDQQISYIPQWWLTPASAGVVVHF